MECALDLASEELRNDREIVLAAVQQNGYALEYASDDIKSDIYFLWELETLGLLSRCDVVDPKILLQLNNFTTMKPAKR